MSRSYPLVNKMARNNCSSELVEEHSCWLFCMPYFCVLLQAMLWWHHQWIARIKCWLSCASSAISQSFGRSALAHFLIHYNTIIEAPYVTGESEARDRGVPDLISWNQAEAGFDRICDIKSGRSRVRICDFVHVFWTAAGVSFSKTSQIPKKCLDPSRTCHLI